MKKGGIVVLILVIIFGIIAICKGMIIKDKDNHDTKSAKNYVVGVAQIVEHPSLDTIKDAFLNRMEELGYVNDKNTKYIIDNAHGDSSLLAPIMQKMESAKADVIVPIATPTAIAAAKYADKIPVVFSAVSDPVAAKLVTDESKPDKNITGTSDVIQVDQIMDLALKMFPNAKSIGCIYNSAEPNSVSSIDKVKEYCKAHNIKFNEANVSNTSELIQATQSLIGKSDILFSPNDNTVASGIDSVAQTAIKAKKPLFVAADSMVEDNGFATIGINYVELGRKTADMVDEVLKGKPISEIPVVEFKDNLNVYVNEGVAEKIGYKIPDSIKKLDNYKAVKYKEK